VTTVDMPDAGGQWPASNELLIPEAERAKTVFDAQVDTVTCAVKAQQDATVKQDQAMTVMYNAWSTANRDADASNLAKFHDTMTTLAIGSVDRARAGAELVQKASAALVTLYTGVLALVFSVTNNPLPPRGVLAPVFLGLAVVLSTAYIAYLEPTTGYNPAPTPVLGPEPKALERLTRSSPQPVISPPDAQCSCAPASSRSVSAWPTSSCRSLPSAPAPRPRPTPPGPPLHGRPRRPVCHWN